MKLRHECFMMMLASPRHAAAQCSRRRDRNSATLCPSLLAPIVPRFRRAAMTSISGALLVSTADYNLGRYLHRIAARFRL